ncbi:hypothetical protein, partial [Vibrio maritimus]|uniref:hypothetical protein n=1 Tax=Vibrio maritimus TaxID=990268 RepID=UPI00406925DD
RYQFVIGGYISSIREHSWNFILRSAVINDRIRILLKTANKTQQENLHVLCPITLTRCTHPPSPR